MSRIESGIAILPMSCSGAASRTSHTIRSPSPTPAGQQRRQVADALRCARACCRRGTRPPARAGAGRRAGRPASSRRRETACAAITPSSSRLRAAQRVQLHERAQPAGGDRVERVARADDARAPGRPAARPRARAGPARRAARSSLPSSAITAAGGSPATTPPRPRPDRPRRPRARAPSAASPERAASSVSGSSPATRTLRPFRASIIGASWRTRPTTRASARSSRATGSRSGWAAAAWASSTAPSTSTCAAARRSRSSRPTSPSPRASASASRARRGSPPRCSTRTSSPSTTPARSTGCSTSRCSTSRASTSSAMLRRDGRLRPYRAIDVCRQVAAALDAAHAMGLIHRDVKPANVLIEGRTAFLTDFGLTKRLDGTHTELTRAGDVVGTIHYVAPEQIEGGAGQRPQRRLLARLPALPLPHRARCPFSRDTDVAVIYAHLSEDAAEALRRCARSWPAGSTRVIAKALDKSPDRRFPTCARPHQRRPRGDRRRRPAATPPPPRTRAREQRHRRRAAGAPRSARRSRGCATRPPRRGGRACCSAAWTPTRARWRGWRSATAST